MRKSFYISALMLITCNVQLVAQTSWMDLWQKYTVAIGDIGKMPDKNSPKIKVPCFKVIATGVIFYVKVNTKVVPCLITAKHVFDDPSTNWNPKKLRIRFTNNQDLPLDKYFGEEIVLVKGGVKKWYCLPEANIDLACLPMPDLNINDTIKMIPYSSISKDDDIYAGLPILVLGYPFIIEESFFVKALVRSGIIAWTPINSADTSKILLDCKLFPGNSGGPVFKVPNSLDKSGRLAIGGSLTEFIGIATKTGIRYNANFKQDYVKGPVYLMDSIGGKMRYEEMIDIGYIEQASKVRRLLQQVQTELNIKSK